jgi:Uma2 family endonuclease
MLKPINTPILTEADYLQGESISEVKHELLDGCVYAMAGASANHERIAGNIDRKLANHLE